MGADLYLRSVSDKARDEYQPKFDAAVEKRNALSKDAPKSELDAAQAAVSEAYAGMYPVDGYFRDSYNPSSLAWLIGVSWWGDVVPLQDDEGNIGGDNLKKLREMFSVPISDDKLEEKRASFSDNPTLEQMREYYEKDRANLIALIDKAIELNEPIYASL